MNLIVVVSRVLAEAFVSGLWQGMLVVSVVAGVLRMLPRLGATARFVVWGVAFGVAVAVPFVHFPGHVAGSGEGVRLGMGWGLAIAVCWGFVTVARLGQLIVQGMRLRQIWREATPVEDGAELMEGRPRGAVLCTSAAVDAPSVIGFWAPKLLIPDWQMSGLSNGELRQIVLHECEHLRRGDDWMNLAQKVGLALFPLNPALLWADRRMGLERELACDAGVVGKTGAPFDYARCLTRLAEQRIGRRTLALALSAWAGESELGRRVGRLLRPVGSMSGIRRQVSLALLVALVAGGGIELARLPRLISFAEETPEVARAMPGNETSSSVARMIPVVYREPLRVVGEIKKGTRGKNARRRTVARQTAPLLPVAHVVSVERKTGMVKTSFEMRMIEVSPEERDATRLVDAVVRGDSASYAALPFGNGWLILQL